MRITLVTETYFPQLNGVSRTLGQLVRVLEDRGDVIQLIHPRYPGITDARPYRYLVRSVRLPSYRELHVPLPPFLGVRRAIDAFGPDLIHVATEATLGLAALRHARRRGLPVVSSFHTNFDQYAGHYGVGWLRGLVWRYLKWFHNATCETYVPSRAAMAALEARGFERLVLWPRGVDAEHFRPDRPGREALRRRLGWGLDDVVIAHVGRLAYEKNVGYLSDALGRAAGARPAVRLLVVGDGPARAELEQRLGAGAYFAGYRSGEDLADHYAAADLFAFASRTETFGNVLLEAMASGLPVVALRDGGPGEIVQDGVTGVALDPDCEPADFAAALVALVDDPERRRRLAAGARAYAASQSWDAVMGALRERYESIVRSHARDRPISEALVPAAGESP